MTGLNDLTRDELRSLVHDIDILAEELNLLPFLNLARELTHLAKPYSQAGEETPEWLLYCLSLLGNIGEYLQPRNRWEATAESIMWDVIAFDEPPSAR